MGSSLGKGPELDDRSNENPIFRLYLGYSRHIIQGGQEVHMRNLAENANKMLKQTTIHMKSKAFFKVTFTYSEKDLDIISNISKIGRVRDSKHS